MIYAVTIRSISAETGTLLGLFVHGNELDSCVVGGCHRAGPNKSAKNITWPHKVEKEKKRGCGRLSHCIHHTLPSAQHRRLPLWVQT